VQAASTGQVPLDAIVKDGVRGAPDVGVLAGRAPDRVTIMVWHYHDDDTAGPEAQVTVALTGLPAGASTVSVTHHRIDSQHSNAYAEWQRMGSPVAPDAAQYAALERASALAPLEGSPSAIAVDGGKAALSFALPRQGVSLLEVRWP
jgi:xylan 1,4-beta-xylosidase